MARTFIAAVKTISVYVVLEFAAAALIATLFSIPPRRLVIPFVLYLVLGVVFVPLLFNARRYFDKPKTGALVFAIAVSVFGLLLAVVTIYSEIVLCIFFC